MSDAKTSGGPDGKGGEGPASVFDPAGVNPARGGTLFVPLCSNCDVCMLKAAGALNVNAGNADQE